MLIPASFIKWILKCPVNRPVFILNIIQQSCGELTAQTNHTSRSVTTCSFQKSRTKHRSFNIKHSSSVSLTLLSDTLFIQKEFAQSWWKSEFCHLVEQIDLVHLEQMFSDRLSAQMLQIDSFIWRFKIVWD